MLFFMEFIYLLTLCIDFSLPLAALASGIVVCVVVNTYHFASN